MHRVARHTTGRLHGAIGSRPPPAPRSPRPTWGDGRKRTGAAVSNRETRARGGGPGSARLACRIHALCIARSRRLTALIDEALLAKHNTYLATVHSSVERPLRVAAPLQRCRGLEGLGLGRVETPAPQGACVLGGGRWGLRPAWALGAHYGRGYRPDQGPLLGWGRFSPNQAGIAAINPLIPTRATIRLML